MTAYNKNVLLLRIKKKISWQCNIKWGKFEDVQNAFRSVKILRHLAVAHKKQTKRWGMCRETSFDCIFIYIHYKMLSNVHFFLLKTMASHKLSFYVLLLLPALCCCCSWRTGNKKKVDFFFWRCFMTSLNAFILVVCYFFIHWRECNKPRKEILGFCWKCFARFRQ